MSKVENDKYLRISLAQYDIVWEDKIANLAYIKSILQDLKGDSDLLVLPEMCTTGFSMNASQLAEPNDGATIIALKNWAKEYKIAICGTFIACENNKFYNRAFYLSDTQEYYYDKKHLFRMGDETEIYSAGKSQLIFEHKGFNLCLLICYDLRFPVWARNKDNSYDLLIYMANWPASRSKVWNTLIEARALENMSYVCAVNRVGEDGLNLHYQGDSKLIDAKGFCLTAFEKNEQGVQTIKISKNELESFRDKFPAWKDADKFEIK